jgi:hypothetical protein
VPSSRGSVLSVVFMKVFSSSRRPGWPPTNATLAAEAVAAAGAICPGPVPFCDSGHPVRGGLTGTAQATVTAGKGAPPMVDA